MLTFLVQKSSVISPLQSVTFFKECSDSEKLRSVMVRVLNAILGFQTAPKPLASGPGNITNFDCSLLPLLLKAFTPSLHRFVEIWYEVFIWCLFSSIGIYVCAALVAFLTLRKHKFGRFYSLMILLMGFFLPLTLGVVSSASVAFVYKTSRFVFASSTGWCIRPDPRFSWL